MLALSPEHSLGAEHLSSYRTTLQSIPNLSSGKFKPVKTLGGTPANKYDLSHQEPPSLCKLNFKFLRSLASVSLTPAGCESAGTFQVPSPKGVSCALWVPLAAVVFKSSWYLQFRKRLQVSVAAAWLLPEKAAAELLREGQKSSRIYHSLLDPQAMERHL